MSKQQKNSAFIKMLKEFPKAFGRVSFRERLMLRTAFDYINEEVIADIKANCDLAIEGRDIKIKELETENAELKEKLNFSTQYYQGEKAKDQLAKAKDLIEDMYDKIPASHSDYYKDVMERARQFIKEIEK